MYDNFLQTSYLKDLSQLNLNEKPEIDLKRLENLNKRRKIYGDITQNASTEDLEVSDSIRKNFVLRHTV